MANCEKCGAPMEAAQAFCSNCGAPNLTSRPIQQGVFPPGSGAPPQPFPLPRPAHAPEARPPRGSRYAPLSTGGFVGMLLLMCIPLLNLILLIVWACGGAKNQNRRSFARAILILLCIFFAAGLTLLLLIPELAEGVHTFWEQAALL